MILEMPRLIETEEWSGYEYDEVLKYFAHRKGEFINWFSGQTGGITKDGKFCVYKDDFDKFCLHIGLLIGNTNG